MPLRNRKI